MQAYPYLIAPHEPTKKQVWLASFTALLTRMSPEEAVEAADRAMELCDEHWKDAMWVQSWHFKHEYPIGHQFGPARPHEPEPLRTTTRRRQTKSRKTSKG